MPVVLAVAVSAGIHLLAVLVPGLRPIFKTLPMAQDDWLVLLILAASIIPVVELVKLVTRGKTANA